MMTLLANVDPDWTGIIAVGGGFVIAIVAIVSGMVRCVFKTRAREQSRREIAAYIAEGSMTPEQGERLMKADPQGK